MLDFRKIFVNDGECMLVITYRWEFEKYDREENFDKLWVEISFVLLFSPGFLVYLFLLPARRILWNKLLSNLQCQRNLRTNFIRFD